MQKKIEARQINLADLDNKIMPKSHKHTMEDMDFDSDSMLITQEDREKWDTVVDKSDADHTHNSDDIEEGENHKFFPDEYKTLIDEMSDKLDGLSSDDIEYYTSDIKVYDNETEHLFVTEGEKAYWNGLEERFLTELEEKTFEMPEDSFFVTSEEKRLIDNLKEKTDSEGNIYYYYRRIIDAIPPEDISENDNKQFVTREEKEIWNGLATIIDNIDSSNVEALSIDNLVVTDNRQFVTKEEKELIGTITDKVDKNHFHTALDITEMHYKSFTSENERNEVNNHEHYYNEIVMPSHFRWFTNFDRERIETLEKQLQLKKILIEASDADQTEFTIDIGSPILKNYSIVSSIITFNGLLLTESKQYSLETTNTAGNELKITLLDPSISDNLLNDYIVAYIFFYAAIDWESDTFETIRTDYNDTIPSNTNMYKLSYRNSSQSVMISINNQKIINFKASDSILSNENLYSKLSFDDFKIFFNNIYSSYNKIIIESDEYDNIEGLNLISVIAQNTENADDDIAIYEFNTYNPDDVKLYVKWKYIYYSYDKFSYTRSAKLYFYVKYINTNNEPVSSLISSNIVSISEDDYNAIIN